MNRNNLTISILMIEFRHMAGSNGNGKVSHPKGTEYESGGTGIFHETKFPTTPSKNRERVVTLVGADGMVVPMSRNPLAPDDLLQG